FALAGTTRLTNSTISGGADSGFSAISAYIEDGDVIVAHSTVTENAVSTSPVLVADTLCGCVPIGTLVLDHTIVAGNPGTGAAAPDISLDPDLAVASSIQWSLIGSVDPGEPATLAILADPANHNLFDATTPISPDLG